MAVNFEIYFVDIYPIYKYLHLRTSLLYIRYSFVLWHGKIGVSWFVPSIYSTKKKLARNYPSGPKIVKIVTS